MVKHWTTTYYFAWRAYNCIFTKQMAKGFSTNCVEMEEKNTNPKITIR
jgi:hypothetical protein